MTAADQWNGQGLQRENLWLGRLAYNIRWLRCSSSENVIERTKMAFASNFP